MKTTDPEDSIVPIVPHVRTLGMEIMVGYG